MESFHLLMHANWGMNLTLEKHPHPLGKLGAGSQPLSHWMGEGGRKAG